VFIRAPWLLRDPDRYGGNSPNHELVLEGTEEWSKRRLRERKVS
jgi:hypothetical protein